MCHTSVILTNHTNTEYLLFMWGTLSLMWWRDIQVWHIHSKKINSNKTLQIFLNVFPSQLKHLNHLCIDHIRNLVLFLTALFIWSFITSLIFSKEWTIKNIGTFINVISVPVSYLSLKTFHIVAVEDECWTKFSGLLLYWLYYHHSAAKWHTCKYQGRVTTIEDMQLPEDYQISNVH